MEHEDRWRVAKVPVPWQAQFDDLRCATGTALYRKRFTVPADWSGQQVALCFGAVNYRAEVSLDGHAIGVHEGGYLPFEFTLDNLAGEHELEVRVVLPSSEADLYPGGFKSCIDGLPVSLMEIIREAGYGAVL